MKLRRGGGIMNYDIDGDVYEWRKRVKLKKNVPNC